MTQNSPNVSDDMQAESLLRDSNRVLEMLATGQSHQEVFKALNIMIEEQVSGTRSSILVLDEEGKHLLFGSAPSLPEAYNEAIHGLAIGPQVGSCGAAAFKDELVIVKDIATDKLWKDFKNVALVHGLTACWSMPVHSSSGKVIGTFALYPDGIRGPTKVELAMISSAAHIVGLAIERWQAEEKMVRLNRTLRMISDCNQALVRASDEQRLLETICALIVDEGGYKMVWVGEVQHDDERRVVPLSHAGSTDSYLESVHISWADNKFGRGPSGCAIRQEKTVVCQDILHDPTFLPWRDQAIWSGYAAIAAFPLTIDEKVTGIMNIYASKANAFHAGEIKLLEELASDLAFGMEVLRRKDEKDVLTEKFNQAQKMEAIGTLTGGIAHDFNNMLSGILGTVYLVQNKFKDNAELQLQMKRIETTGFRAAEMISQLLTFARKCVTNMQPMTLGSFLKEAFKLSRSSIPENIRMTLEVPDIECTVNGDATLLQQILLNLMTNAKHAVAGQTHPEICVSLKVVEPDAVLRARHPEFGDRTHVCLSVEDNGCGISEQDRNKLFDPFFTTKAVGEGTGLGLAMVYGAVETHEGFIDVESDEGNGAVFRIFLPLLDQIVEPSEAEEDKLLEGHGETILLADDEEIVRTVTRELLEAIGYRVLTAANGEEAIGIFAKHQTEIRLAILDVVMPQLGGVDAAIQMRALDAGLPILFQTGYGEEQVLGEMKNVKDYRLVTKPVSLPSFARVLRGLLEKDEG